MTLHGSAPSYTPLTLKDIEEAVGNKEHKESDFVMATQADAEPVDAAEGKTVEMIEPEQVAEHAEKEPIYNQMVEMDVQDIPETDRTPAEEDAEVQVFISDGEPEEGSVDAVAVECLASATKDDHVEASAVEAEIKDNGTSKNDNIAEHCDDEDEEMTDSIFEEEAVIKKAATPEEDGYDCAMDLLQLIYDNADENTLKIRYGSKWSLEGMLGTTYEDAKKMLADVRDYFAFHVGEIVALASNAKTVAGVVIFVDPEGAIGVFDGEKILSYKEEALVKTGKVFKDALQTSGLFAQA